MGDRKLSKQQRHTLCWLEARMRELEEARARTTREIEAHPDDRDIRCRQACCEWTMAWGVPWRDGQARSPSATAARSRALRQLERRGLVLRQNQVSGCPGFDEDAPRRGSKRRSAADPHDRTTDVELTELGRAVARRLIERAAADVNRREGPAP
jgi:hypothetical protein